MGCRHGRRPRPAVKPLCSSGSGTWLQAAVTCSYAGTGLRVTLEECPSLQHMGELRAGKRVLTCQRAGAALRVTLLGAPLHQGHVVGSALGGTVRSPQTWQTPSLHAGETAERVCAGGGLASAVRPPAPRPAPPAPRQPGLRTAHVRPVGLDPGPPGKPPGPLHAPRSLPRSHLHRPPAGEVQPGPQSSRLRLTRPP